MESLSPDRPVLLWHDQLIPDSDSPEWQELADRVLRPEWSQPSLLHRHCDPPGRYVMHFLRHLVALAIIASCGYGYFKQRQSSSDVPREEADFDPFAGWDNGTQAPRFQAEVSSDSRPEPSGGEHGEVEKLPSSAAEAVKPLRAPQPIPFPVAESGGLNTELSAWTGQKPQIAGQSLSSTRPAQSQQPQQPTGVTKSGPREPSSIWEQPSGPQQQQQKPAGAAAVPAGRSPAISPFSSQAGSVNKENPPAEIARTVPRPSDAPVVKSAEPASVPAPQPVYRQFNLGTGPRKIACVIDSTVAGDGLLLSTLYGGLQREWSDNIERSRAQTLVLLVADMQRSADPDQFQKQVAAQLVSLQPERIVSITQGTDTRGTLKFSSADESIAALMSVPGTFRIRENESSGQSAAAFAGQPATVHIELPREIATREGETVRLLSTALMSGWSGTAAVSGSPAATPPAEKPPAIAAKPAPSAEPTTSSVFEQLYSQTTPNPIKQPPAASAPASRTDQKSLIEQAESMMAQFLSKADSIPVNPVPSEKKQSEVPTPVDLLPPPEPAKSVSPETLIPAVVEFLQPPPAYRPRTPAKIDSNDFFKLPPPTARP